MGPGIRDFIFQNGSEIRTGLVYSTSLTYPNKIYSHNLTQK